MNNEWILLDTETTGIQYPIHILEVFALRMKGWLPQDRGLHLYLNHNIRIPPRATAIHGYTREFLRTNGRHPLDCHQQLYNYIGERPITAHNLPYDWNRCLIPETDRLQIPTPGRAGFCSLQLLKRSIANTSSYKIEALQERFHINQKAHNAKGDVLTIQEILEKHVGPILTKANITEPDDLKKFSKITPIKVCNAILGIPTNTYEFKKFSNPTELGANVNFLIENEGINEEKIQRLHELLKTNTNKSRKIKLLKKQTEQIILNGKVTWEDKISIIKTISQIRPQNQSGNKPTATQIQYLTDLGGKVHPNSNRQQVAEQIETRCKQQANHKSTPRQRAVLRFWGIEPNLNATRQQTAQWVENFYNDNPNRRKAWELYKANHPELLQDPNLKNIEPKGREYLQRVNEFS